jgi:uncharacterized membrane protein YqaE (UPF0057 family)
MKLAGGPIDLTTPSTMFSSISRLPADRLITTTIVLLSSLSISCYALQRHGCSINSFERTPMRLLIAFIFPWLTFFTIGRPIAGIICLILQITILGWIPATIWAVYALSQFKTDQKIERALGERSA